MKSDTIGLVSGFYKRSFRILEREVQMAENEQPFIPALVQEFVDPEYASTAGPINYFTFEQDLQAVLPIKSKVNYAVPCSLHIGEGRQ